MKRIVIIKDKDKLIREQWHFIYLDNRHALVMTDYIQETRPTPRHKFQTVEAWDTYRDKRREYGRDVVTLDAPPLPDEIRAEAIETFAKTLKVTDHF